jgi:protein-ribulosamine 3-kinase
MMLGTFGLERALRSFGPEYVCPPTGMFGFHTTTHLAKFPVDNAWNPSWEEFWAQQMRSMFAQEQERHGVDGDLERLKELYLKR